MLALRWRLLALIALALAAPGEARRHRYGNGRYGSYGSPDQAQSRSAITRPQRVADPLALAREEAAPEEEEVVDTRPEDSLEAVEDDVIQATTRGRVQLDGAPARCTRSHAILASRKQVCPLPER